MSFTHLHVHTEYSLLDGAAKINEAVKKAKELGMDSLAITDHGAMFGVIDFYKECKKQGIHPVLGCEVYMAARTRFDKDAGLDSKMGHLILLAENNEGYKNLMKIVSRSYTEGFYYKPRVDYDLLRKHSKGIICTSACLQGNVQRALLNRNYEGAKREALLMREIFGADNFFLELQDQGLEEEARIFDDMMRLHEETGIPLIATNDVHYISQEDAKAHDILLCIQTASNIDDPDRMRFQNDQFYLKSEEEMREIFRAVPEAIDNTHKIAMRCNVEIDFGNYHLPEFTPPQGFTNEEYLRKLCDDGLRERYGDDAEKNRERLEYELSVISGMGYVEYFLIVWDFINFARKKGIFVGPGRGSAAGSIVSYCLRITNIDPIKNGLIFERFLNPERVSMPDIDIDFCYERRGEVIDYVIEKYGSEKVAQIITFGTMKAKAAVRDVARVLNVSYKEADDIAKAIPNELHMTIDKALVMNPDLARMYEENDNVKKVIDAARQIEGMPRNTSTHAAGIVISKENIEEYVPLHWSKKGVSTQFTMTTIEELGLLKMDFLGLKNLTIIRYALEMIEERHDVKIDLDNLTYDDPKVYEMISEGNTQGVFQLESSGMTQFMKSLRPDCFEDIVAGISLYRPGPMGSIPTYIENKKHPDSIKYIDKSLEPILSVTYGCMVYQEQVMQIVRDLAGYTYGRSDLLRRAMSKKKMDVMLSEKEVFMKGAMAKGISKEACEEIFNQMVSFAEYAFNKSHAAAYAVLGYETAYLKCHYTEEFMAALLSVAMGNASDIAKYIKNCNEMGIEVLPPDINESDKNFTVAGDKKVRFGMLAIKNLGEGAIENIVEERNRNGKYKDFTSFTERIDTTAVNKKACESMIKAGVFDSINKNRAQLFAVYETFLESAQASGKSNIKGQISLFQTSKDTMEEASKKALPDVANFDRKKLAQFEKEMLGIYISDHPLNEYKDAIEDFTNANTIMLNDPEEEELRDGDQVKIAGIIEKSRTITTKKNQLMSFITLEDFYGDIEVIAFPSVFDKYSHLIHSDAVIAVSGKVQFKENESPQVIADIISDIDAIASTSKKHSPVNRVKIKLKGDRLETDKNLSFIMEKAELNPGDAEILIYLPGKNKPVRAKGIKISPNARVLADLKSVFGDDNVKFERND